MNESLIQKQVCTIEQAGKLRELGFEQNSLFWFEIGILGTVKIRNEKPLIFNRFSAYTETELKAFLPYGRVHPNQSAKEKADFLIKLIEVEGMDVEEYNLNYVEFFDIE